MTAEEHLKAAAVAYATARHDNNKKALERAADTMKDAAVAYGYPIALKKIMEERRP